MVEISVSTSSSKETKFLNKDCILYLNSGTMNLAANGITYQMTKETACFLSRGVIINKTPLGENIKYLTVEFNREDLIPTVVEMLNSKTRFCNVSKTIVPQRFQSLIEEKNTDMQFMEISQIICFLFKQKSSTVPIIREDNSLQLILNFEKENNYSKSYVYEKTKKISKKEINSKLTMTEYQYQLRMKSFMVKEFIYQGYPKKDSCNMANISYSTYHRYVNSDKELEKYVDEVND